MAKVSPEMARVGFVGLGIFALALCRAAGVFLPAIALVHELFGALLGTEGRDLDHPSLACLLHNRAGLPSSP